MTAAFHKQIAQFLQAALDESGGREVKGVVCVLSAESGSDLERVDAVRFVVPQNKDALVEDAVQWTGFGVPRHSLSGSDFALAENERFAIDIIPDDVVEYVQKRVVVRSVGECFGNDCAQNSAQLSIKVGVEVGNRTAAVIVRIVANGQTCGAAALGSVLETTRLHCMLQ